MVSAVGQTGDPEPTPDSEGGGPYPGYTHGLWPTKGPKGLQGLVLDQNPQSRVGRQVLGISGVDGEPENELCAGRICSHQPSSSEPPFKGLAPAWRTRPQGLTPSLLPPPPPSVLGAKPPSEEGRRARWGVCWRQRGRWSSTFLWRHLWRKQGTGLWWGEGPGLGGVGRALRKWG